MNGYLVYDPVVDTWTETGPLGRGLQGVGRATPLPDGRVLAMGGPSGRLGPAVRILDPRTLTWTEAASPRAVRQVDVAIPLPNGSVLVIGPGYGLTLAAEVFEGGEWRYPSRLTHDRQGYTVTVLANGAVLVAGGLANGGAVLDAEIHDP